MRAEVLRDSEIRSGSDLHAPLSKATAGPILPATPTPKVHAWDAQAANQGYFFEAPPEPLHYVELLNMEARSSWVLLKT
jgi:hypothetical protein